MLKRDYSNQHIQSIRLWCKGYRKPDLCASEKHTNQSAPPWNCLAGWMYCQFPWNAFGEGLFFGHSIHRQRLWWAFLPSACQLHAPSKLGTSGALCCLIKLHILEWPFVMGSLRHTWAITMLSNQQLDTPHLWAGWMISAKEKRSPIPIQADFWTIFKSNRTCTNRNLRCLCSAHEKLQPKQNCFCIYICIRIFFSVSNKRLV